MEQEYNKYNHYNNEPCQLRLSKSGRNLNARIPDDFRHKFGRGDLVQITIIKKAPLPIDSDKLRSSIREFIQNPHSEKFKGNIMGYPVDFPIRKILKLLPEDKQESLLFELLTETVR